MAGLIGRGNIFYIQWYVGKKEKRRSLQTDSLQIAKEKLRQFESARARGDELPLPTRTNLTEIITRYVEHVRTVKTAKSAQTDIYYLRQVFGAICPALQINSRKASVRAMKKPPKSGQDRRFKMSTLDVSYPIPWLA
jgi:succinate dehydrogenase/fumarate reductase flavoprotein subunit